MVSGTQKAVLSSKMDAAAAADIETLPLPSVVHVSVHSMVINGWSIMDNSDPSSFFPGVDRCFLSWRELSKSRTCLAACWVSPTREWLTEDRLWVDQVVLRIVYWYFGGVLWAYSPLSGICGTRGVCWEDLSGVVISSWPWKKYTDFCFRCKWWKNSLHAFFLNTTRARF